MWSNMNYDSVLASGKNFIKKAQELDLSLNEVVVYPQKAQDEINSLKSENASLSSDLSAMRLKLRLFKPMDDTNASLVLNDAKDAHEKLALDLKDLNAQLSLKSSDLETLKSRLDQIQIENNVLKTQNSILLNDSETLKITITDLSSLSDSLKKDNESLLTESRALKKINSTLKNQQTLDPTLDLLITGDKITNPDLDLESKILNPEINNQELTESNSKLEAQVSRLSKLETINKELTESNSKLEAQVSSLLNLDTINQELTESKSKLEVQVSNLSTNLESLNKELTEYKSKLETEESKHSKLDQELSDSKSESESSKPSNLHSVNLELSNQKSKLEAEISSLNTKILNLESLNIEISNTKSKLEADILALNKTISSQTETKPDIDLAKMKEIDDRNFTLGEINQDLKIQVASRVAEVVQLNAQISEIKSENEKVCKEYEEKLKKLKGILQSANKSFNENKEKLFKTESSLQDSMIKLSELENEISERDKSIKDKNGLIDSLNFDLDNFKSNKMAEMTEMHRQISSSESQYNTLSLEFSQYKIKAAAALGKVSTNALESRIKQLSDHIHKIETINHEKALEIEILEKKCTDFAETINIRDKEQLNLEETVSKLYAEMYQIESLKNDILVLNKRIETQSNIHRQEISKMETIHFDQIQNTKQGFKNTIADLEEKIKIKTEENLTLNAISERLGLEVGTIRSELDYNRRELEETKSRFADLQAMDSDFYRRPSSTTSVRPSISSPESQHASRQPDMSSFKEKEYLFNIKELQSLLNESESNMDRLNETISILKKELENNERAEMRKDMNIEYLKNIVLAYFDAFDKEPLITVLARVLQLSEEEVDKLRKSSVGNTLPVASGWYF